MITIWSQLSNHNLCYKWLSSLEDEDRTTIDFYHNLSSVLKDVKGRKKSKISIQLWLQFSQSIFIMCIGFGVHLCATHYLAELEWLSELYSLSVVSTDRNYDSQLAPGCSELKTFKRFLRYHTENHRIHQKL